MKLPELEKLAQEDMLGGTIANLSALAEADPAGVLTICATFREMLEVLKHVQGCMSFPVSEKLIKKAEEML